MADIIDFKPKRAPTLEETMRLSRDAEDRRYEQERKGNWKIFAGVLVGLGLFVKFSSDNPGNKASMKVLNMIQANPNAQVALFGRKTLGIQDVSALSPSTAVGWQALSAKAKAAGFADIGAAIDAFVLVF